MLVDLKHCAKISPQNGDSISWLSAFTNCHTHSYFFAHKGRWKIEWWFKFLNKEDYPVDPSTKSCRWIRWIRLLDLEKERNSDWLIQLDTNKSLAHKSIEVTPCKEHHICSSAKSIECWKYTMNRNTICGCLPKVLKVHHVQCTPYTVVCRPRLKSAPRPPPSAQAESANFRPFYVKKADFSPPPSASALVVCTL